MSGHVYSDPMPTSAEFDALVARLRGTPFNADTTTVADLRSNFERFAATFCDIPDSTVFEEVEGADVELEWAIAKGASRSSAVLYFHGGGYTIGSIPAYRDHCARISATTGTAVLSVGYRLAPENPHPAALDDCVAAYRWLRSTGIRADSIALAGDSAGGGLVLSTLIALRDAGDELPAAGVCISPLADLAHTGDSVTERAHLDPIVSPEGSHAYAVRYLGEDGDFALPSASPLFADLHGLPPLLVQVGTSEVLLDDSIRLVRKVKAAGGEAELDAWPRMIHIFPFFASQIPEAREGVAQIATYIRSHIHIDG